MNIRRLQQTGVQKDKDTNEEKGGSFLIILPKQWVSRQNLKKGDPVVVSEREDGCLIIDPRYSKAGETRSTSIPIEPNLRWSITSKYLLGFDEIRIVSKKPLTNKHRDELKRIIKRFVALEVTDETENEIIIQCLVDPSTLPVDKAMKRMDLITSRMFNDAMHAYFEGQRDMANAVIERDEEVDRLFFLIVRELRSAIQYPSMSETMGINPVSALDFRLAAQYIERIADLAVDIARKTSDPVDSKISKKMMPLVEQIKRMHSESVSNLFKFNSEKVSWVIAAEKELIDGIAKVRQDILASPNGDIQAQLHVIDSLLKIGEASKDIVDLALPTN
ncbi:MAG: PhoU domain-containing protein [Candidatus Thorarchaeota archaeon]